MIRGLRLQIPGADLKAHIATRFDHHREQAEKYEKRLDAMGDLPADGGVSNDPVTTLRAKRGEHQQKATFFGLLVRYIDTTETYDLEPQDLSRLEFVSMWF